jgi:hypothetical protein
MRPRRRGVAALPEEVRTRSLHLFRGAPAVRGWSKYQETVYRWTLCGINRKTDQPSVGNAAGATEDRFLVTCRFCLQLMRSGARSRAKGATAADIAASSRAPWAVLPRG